MEGEWLHDQLCGTGISTTAGGLKSSGNFKFGKLNGEGKCEYPNGDIYIGGFENNLRSGQGKYFFANGDTFFGMYLEGFPVESNTVNVFTYGGGNVFTGETKNMKPNGQGAMKVDSVMLLRQFMFLATQRHPNIYFISYSLQIPQFIMGE